MSSCELAGSNVREIARQAREYPESPNDLQHEGERPAPETPLRSDAAAGRGTGWDAARNARKLTSWLPPFAAWRVEAWVGL